MPMNDHFRSAAQQLGYNPHEIDTFLSLAQTENKPVSSVMAEHGQQSVLDAFGKQGVTPGDFDNMSEMSMKDATPSAPALPTAPQSIEKNSLDVSNPLSSTSSAQPTPSLPTPPTAPSTAPDQTMPMPTLPKQSGILPGQFGLGTAANVRQSADQFSGGVNYGRDVLAPKGTPVATPPGSQWKVVESFSGDPYEGSSQSFDQKKINRGYGNSALLENTKTGERMRFSHLSENNLKPGQMIDGGSVFGKTGASGNVAGPTGQHLDIEYYDGTGKIRDVMDSPYGKMLFGGQSSGEQSSPPPAPSAPTPQTLPPTAPPQEPAPASPSATLQPSLTPPDPASIAPPSASQSAVLAPSLPEKQKAFIDKFLPSAQRIEKQYGIPVSISIAQAGLESGWNPEAQTLFGLKGSGDAGSANLGTKEQGANGLYNTTGSFAQYSSPDASWDAYGKLLSTSPRYAPVMDALKKGNLEAAVQMIKQGGYATDDQYVSKIMNLINTYKLNQLPSTYLQR